MSLFAGASAFEKLVQEDVQYEWAKASPILQDCMLVVSFLSQTVSDGLNVCHACWECQETHGMYGQGLVLGIGHI